MDGSVCDVQQVCVNDPTPVKNNRSYRCTCHELWIADVSSGFNSLIIQTEVRSEIIPGLLVIMEEQTCHSVRDSRNHWKTCNTERNNENENSYNTECYFYQLNH